MKSFSNRERRIIAAVYADARRICRERQWEITHGHREITASDLAGHLAHLCDVRKEQILKHGCSLPMRKP